VGPPGENIIPVRKRSPAILLRRARKCFSRVRQLRARKKNDRSADASLRPLELFFQGIFGGLGTICLVSGFFLRSAVQWRPRRGRQKEGKIPIWREFRDLEGGIFIAQLGGPLEKSDNHGERRKRFRPGGIGTRKDTPKRGRRQVWSSINKGGGRRTCVGASEEKVNEEASGSRRAEKKK